MKKSIISMDIESSGFNGFPIQIGVIKEDGSKYEALIKPEEGWLEEFGWCKEAENVHNIKLDKILKEGLSGRDVATQLNLFLDKLDVYVDSEFDIIWIDILFKKLNIKRLFNIIVLYKILPNEFMNHWDLVFESELKISGLKLHNAINDAVLNQRTYIRIAKHF